VIITSNLIYEKIWLKSIQIFKKSNNTNLVSNILI